MKTENFNLTKKSIIEDKLSEVVIEKDSICAKGFLYDELIYPDGTRKIIHNWKQNLIVLSFAKLVGVLLSDESGYSGTQYWAVGQGEGVSWDTLSETERQAKSTLSRTTLYGEVDRQTITINYLDSSDAITTLSGFLSSTVARLQIRATFGTGVSGYLREYGIFGGNATGTADSGLMFNHKAHTLISLNVGGVTGMSLSRSLKLYLQ